MSIDSGGLTQASPTNNTNVFSSLYQGTVSALTGGIRIFAEAAGKVGIMLANGYKQTLDFSRSTAARNFAFPDLAGTVQVWPADDTYANFVTNIANYSIGQRVRCTNGINGFDIIKISSTRWIPVNGHAPLSETSIPFLKVGTFPADGSGTANGAITLNAALDVAIIKAWVYFPANVVNASQPAGIYPVVFSSTTAAIVYNNMYTPAVGTEPTWPGSLTAFSGAVPGDASSTTSEITFYKFKLPANLLGTLGSLMSHTGFAQIANSNSKSFRLYYDASFVASVNFATATNQVLSGTTAIVNMGQTNKQYRLLLGYNASSNPARVATAIDTSADVTVSMTMQTAGAATDWMCIQFAKFFAEVYS